MNDINNESYNYVALDIDGVIEEMRSLSKALILFHVHPDADAAASAFALKQMLISMGKYAYCVCEDELPERLSFIMDGQDSVNVSSIPCDITFDKVFTVDSASPSQLGSLYTLYKDKIDVMIDHHKVGNIYANNYIDPCASSCGEVLYHIFKRIEDKDNIKMPKCVCELIYTAICSDTGCFRYYNVSDTTFDIASELYKRNVDMPSINHKLFGIKSLKQMQVEHAGFERMNFYLDGKIAVITFPYSLKEQYMAEDETLETLIDVARCVKGVEIAAVVKQLTDENRFKVSMRSSSDFDVSKLCALYGGGGHVHASGCTLVCDSILAAEITLVSAIENMLLDNNEISKNL